MGKYVIVWNRTKTEGVILSKEHDEDDALDDAYHAGGGVRNYGFRGVSTIADNFRETYGESGDCFIQHVEIDTAEVQRIEKDGE